MSYSIANAKQPSFSIYSSAYTVYQNWSSTTLKGGFSDGKAEVFRSLNQLGINIPQGTLKKFEDNLKNHNIIISGSSVFDDCVIIGVSKNNKILTYDDMKMVINELTPDLISDNDRIMIV